MNVILRWSKEAPLNSGGVRCPISKRAVSLAPLDEARAVGAYRFSSLLKAGLVHIPMSEYRYVIEHAMKPPSHSHDHGI